MNNSNLYQYYCCLYSLALKKVKELASKLISGNGLTERDMTGKPKGHVVLNKNNQLKAQLIQALAKPGESILLFLPGMLSG